MGIPTYSQARSIRQSSQSIQSTQRRIQHASATERRCGSAGRSSFRCTGLIAWLLCVCICARMWDVRSGECLRTWKGHSDAVLTFRVTPDAGVIVSGSDDNSALVFRR